MNTPGPKNFRLSRPSLKHPGRWVWLLLAVPIVLGLARLRFDVEVFDLLPADLTAVQGLKLYQRYFSNARELILTLDGKDAEHTETVARSIAEALRQDTNLVAVVTWEPPWLEHPEQAAELMAYLWFNQPPELFDGLLGRLAPDKLADTLVAAREELGSSMSPQEIARLSYDPFGLTRLPESTAGAAPSFAQGQEAFGSSDGTFRIVFVQARPELSTYRDCRQWLNKIKEEVAAAAGKVPGGVAIGYTGRPAFVVEIAGGMEHDINTSVGGTAIIIAILFWLAHRRIKPMLWLLTLLALILASTLALGGLVFGAINVVSIGFAAILLGLAVDYAVVHYQEALTHPDLTIPEVRHAIAPSIFWAAVTTITAFLVLNLGGLPGLGQLGTMVGMGVGLAATIMIFEFLPPLFPGRNELRNVQLDPNTQEPPQAEGRRSLSAPAQQPLSMTSRLWPALALFLTLGTILITLVVLAFGVPRIDTTANALRPSESQAYSAVERIQANLNQKREPLWLIVGGRDEAEVAQRLDQVQPILANAVTNGIIADFNLPSPLWPRPDYQAQNRVIAGRLADKREAFHRAAATNGFAEASLALADRMLDDWRWASSSKDIFWPTNPMSRWIFEKCTARTATNCFALGLVNLHPDESTKASAVSTLEVQLPRQNVWLSGWELLGTAIYSRVKENMWKVVAPMVTLVLLSLYLAFRKLREILLSLAVLFLSGLCLLAIMRLAGWSWNLLNLMAIPLMLGTGVDYSIFMQLALRRHQGDLTMAYRSVGRALLLCGGTAIAGFGSLAWSSNAGMASLGQVCAVGIGSNMLIAIFLLPIWWKAIGRRSGQPTAGLGADEPDPRTLQNNPDSPSHPSSLYRSEFWRLGLLAVKLLPAATCAWLAQLLVKTYWLFATHRRRVVIRNLLPAVKGNALEARKTAKSLFEQFALKLVDLWRYEAGLPIDDLLGQTSGWDHFTQAMGQHRGVLLLTPHLGNWEFGGPLLTRQGVRLQVITLAEPGQKLTELRQQSRARWNIETLVIRDDPLAFLEIIRRLEAGATVALLIDRPPPPTAITVELFGQPFAASVAAAELARASGCVLLPVYLPRNAHSYEAHILDPIPYERPALRERIARQELTQRIVKTFEPLILQHLDQWYHFVPVWGSSGPQAGPEGKG